MFRIYDKKKKQWIRHDVFLTQNGDLAVIKTRFLTGKQVKLLSSQRYQYHMDIGIRDCQKCLIHEGDICHVQINNDENDKIGLIIYFPEIASYVFVDYKENKYYPLSKTMCEQKLKVVGNCFDNAYLIPQLNEESEIELSEQESDLRINPDKIDNYESDRQAE